MIIGSAMKTTVECPRPLRGADHMHPGNLMTGIHMVTSEDIQLTPENLDLMQGQFWYKVWSTGTELTDKDMTEINQQETEYMYLDLSVSALLSGPRKSLRTLGWRLW